MKKSRFEDHDNQTQSKQKILQENATKSQLQLFKLPAIIIIGILIVYLLWPAITIIPGKSINPRAPFDTSFMIKNNSVYPIHEIKGEFRFLNIEDDSHRNFDKLSNRIDVLNLEKLNSFESKSMIFKINITGLDKSVLKANINLFLFYKLPLIGINLSKAIPLKVEKTPENTYKWSVIS
jgi:hypothetical protein